MTTSESTLFTRSIRLASIHVFLNALPMHKQETNQKMSTSISHVIDHRQNRFASIHTPEYTFNRNKGIHGGEERPHWRHQQVGAVASSSSSRDVVREDAKGTYK